MTKKKTKLYDKVTIVAQMTLKEDAENVAKSWRRDKRFDVWVSKKNRHGKYWVKVKAKKGAFKD